ncbi:golgin subfamily A member 6-like protein 22 isoform X2 [Diorhabda sublineata]|uniref:golgin subfamily A member 6-like protein 22 isoform X2 n=1 Tax=Diorhabda sublineata TaxID=1163346 RepID=UPI0024E11E4D|nr:golgin subfamily A member 6-like protein 22 isoform X2 [Diorhabda sublineata]
MSFVRSIFGSGDNKDTEVEDDTSDETSSSSDTGFLSNMSNSDLENSLGSNGNGDPDCSTISNFFGYWKNLVNQEAKFQSKLNELTKELSIRDAEANKLRFQMEELQRDAFAKSAGMDRLESELKEAQKECESIGRTIRTLENDLENQKKRNILLNRELEEKTESFSVSEKDYKSKIEYLENVIAELRQRIENLEQQIKSLQEEKLQLSKRQEEILLERGEETEKIVKTLEQTQKQKEQLEEKWKKDFENLRTVNILREQELLNDFEWKLRDVEQTCKKKIDEKEEILQISLEHSRNKEKEAEELSLKMESLKLLEEEVNELKEKTTDQSKIMKNMHDEHEQMRENEENLKSEVKKLRNLINLEKENLQHMQRMHQQEILDKERKLQQTLNEKKIEIATYWEEKLLNEISRLKDELEQVYTEEKYTAIESVKRNKDADFRKAQEQWKQKYQEYVNEVHTLKNALEEKDKYYKEEIVKQQSITDQDIFELRRLMDKLDMSHHDKYEKLVLQHETEIEKLRAEHEENIENRDKYWQSEIDILNSTIANMKLQMENETQEKLQILIQNHQGELEQWENLIQQKKEAIQFLEEKYIAKCVQLEEQLNVLQKSHSAREVELLKTVDSLKNEIQSKESIIQDMQSNMDMLEGGIQVLNKELAEQSELMAKEKKESEQKLRNILSKISKIQSENEKEQETYRLKFINSQKQYQQTIDHMQRKYQCLTKLFEEVRQRYERRESKQEDLNIIADLKQIITEQEKDLNCLNEEKRYFQMKLIALENSLDHKCSSEDESLKDETISDSNSTALPNQSTNTLNSNLTETKNGDIISVCVPLALPDLNQQTTYLSIPPTIEECDE